MPIGGADMPVVISLLNSFTGIAAAMAGFIYQNQAMILGGIFVGAAGMILTLLMCKAMNRSLINVIIGSFGGGGAGIDREAGTIKEDFRNRCSRNAELQQQGGHCSRIWTGSCPGPAYL